MYRTFKKYGICIAGIVLTCSFRFSAPDAGFPQRHGSENHHPTSPEMFVDTLPKDTIRRDTIPGDSAVMFTPDDSSGLVLIDGVWHEVAAIERAPSRKIPVEFSTVKVWYATDRNQTTDKVPFGTDRSTISYGQCEVTVPKIHKMGEIESRSIFEYFFDDDPARHMILKKTTGISESVYFSQLSASVNTAADKSAFIFIHGYNTSFEDAAKRTAQICYDLKFAGAPVFFSWPSQAQVSKYTIDEANIEWSQTHVEAFLTDFLKKTTTQNLYIIAHSMGNRAMTRAIAAVTNKFPTYKNRIKAIILAAPDVDSDVFKRDIAPALVSACKNITLYTSNTDKALIASQKVHGHSRLGDNLNGVVTIPGIESIDATDIESDFLSHSYFSSTKTLISDMFSIIKEGKSASMRFGLEKINASPIHYWRFSK